MKKTETQRKIRDEIILNIIVESKKSHTHLKAYLLKNVRDLKTFNSIRRVIRQLGKKDIEDYLEEYRQAFKLPGDK
ncbi:MAG: hypothetical protein HAW60_05960 [Bdellovibrionales bacterium]|nr:hypothetical protein [Bdellovibrionales bacterium]